jgi:hypothetical protein
MRNIPVTARDSGNADLSGTKICGPPGKVEMQILSGTKICLAHFFLHRRILALKLSLINRTVILKQLLKNQMGFIDQSRE